MKSAGLQPMEKNPKSLRPDTQPPELFSSTSCVVSAFSSLVLFYVTRWHRLLQHLLGVGKHQLHGCICDAN